MKTTRTVAQSVGISAVLLLTLQATALAQVSIRLEGVPDRLHLPLHDGANQVLTATTKGGQVSSVWLAMTQDAPSSQRVMLARTGESAFAVNLGASEVLELLKTGPDQGQFRIFAQAENGPTVGSVAVRYALHLPPRRLDFPFDEAKMTIYQRDAKEIPGSNGALRVRLGDITAGQVLVTVEGPGREMLVDKTSMKAGDTVSLVLTEENYILRLDKLINLLMGNDYAVFTLMPRHHYEANRIDALLGIIERSDVTFIRNDHELTGQAFAAHLRGKHRFYGTSGTSLAGFIENIASRSSTTGRPYRVKLANGEIVDAGEWLRDQAARLDAPPNQADDPAHDSKAPAPSR